MDIIIEILDACNTDEIALFSAINSVIPIDYYIPLISHTFGMNWLLEEFRTYTVDDRRVVTRNDTSRRSKPHTYDDTFSTFIVKSRDLLRIIKSMYRNGFKTYFQQIWIWYRRDLFIDYVKIEGYRMPTMKYWYENDKTRVIKRLQGIESEEIKKAYSQDEIKNWLIEKYSVEF